MNLNPHIPLGAIDGDIVLRLGVAAIIGLLLGLDREMRGHARGCARMVSFASLPPR